MWRGGALSASARRWRRFWESVDAVGNAFRASHGPDQHIRVRAISVEKTVCPAADIGWERCAEHHRAIRARESAPSVRKYLQANTEPGACSPRGGCSPLCAGRGVTFGVCAHTLRTRRIHKITVGARASGRRKRPTVSVIPSGKRQRVDTSVCADQPRRRPHGCSTALQTARAGTLWDS